MKYLINTPPLALQERQRLETILNLCSEYNKAGSGTAGVTVSSIEKIGEELHKLSLSHSRGCSPHLEASSHSGSESEPRANTRALPCTSPMFDFTPSGRRSRRNSGPLEPGGGVELNRLGRSLQQLSPSVAETSPNYADVFTSSYSPKLPHWQNDPAERLSPFSDVRERVAREASNVVSLPTSQGWVYTVQRHSPLHSQRAGGGYLTIRGQTRVFTCMDCNQLASIHPCPSHAGGLGNKTFHQQGVSSVEKCFVGTFTRFWPVVGFTVCGRGERSHKA